MKLIHAERFVAEGTSRSSTYTIHLPYSLNHFNKRIHVFFNFIQINDFTSVTVQSSFLIKVLVQA